MQQTLNLLTPLIVPAHRKLTLEQIAEAYGESLNPSLLALAFEKVFKLVIHISREYYGLTPQDIASFSLEKLDAALQTYKSGQAVFTTYYSRILHNKFREETQALNTHKRKACLYSESLQELSAGGFEVACTMDTDGEMAEDLNSCDLTPRELEYCSLLVNEYTNKEIAAHFGVSTMTLCNMRKSLRRKLSPLMVYDS